MVVKGKYAWKGSSARMRCPGQIRSFVPTWSMHLSQRFLAALAKEAGLEPLRFKAMKVG